MRDPLTSLLGDVRRREVLMPTDKDFKRLVRQRMAATGERYTAARAALAPAPIATKPSLPGRRLIELLGHPVHNEDAFARLKSLPPDDLRPAAIFGTRHPSPKVRRRSCQLLDDLALTPQSITALEACTLDPEPLVRAAALHSLACERCKPDGVCLDERVLTERAVSDPSAKVRRGVAMTLSWNRELSDDWHLDLATRLLSDASAEIRRYAQIAVDRIEGQRHSDAERRRLPEPLQTKTQRHRGKWVAVEDGRIVATDPKPTWKRNHPRARMYFVSV